MDLLAMKAFFTASPNNFYCALYTDNLLTYFV